MTSPLLKRPPRTVRWKLALMAAALCFVASVGLAVGLEYHYSRTRPFAAHPQEGRIYRIRFSTRRVYLNSEEAFTVRFLWGFGMVTLITAGLIELFADPYEHERRWREHRARGR